MTVPTLGEGWDDFGPIQKQDPKNLPSIPQEDWEVLDASKYFPEYRHANTVTQVDRPADMQKVEAPQDGFSNEAQEGEASPPQDGDQYCEASPEEQAKHSDQLYEMEAGPEDKGSADDRELRADKEEDLRTEKPESQSGAEEPIQKESEGIDEVAEATSKTSEDVHGGDEATKDIEDSPNAADNGKNEENKGAKEGKDGQGDQGQGDVPSSEGDNQEGDGNGVGNQPGDQPSDEAGGEGGNGQNPFTFLDKEEDWEKQANASAWVKRMAHQFVDWKNHERRKEDAGGGKGVNYQDFDQWTPEDAKAIFFKVRELITKLVSQPDPSKKEKGSAKWWLEQLIKEATSFQYHKIPQAKYNRPMKNNIVFFIDISGSVSSLAELFMALMGGAAGLPGVHIVVGSEAHAESEISVERPFKNVEQAIEYFRRALSGETAEGEMGSNAVIRDAWYRPYEHPFEPGVVQYLKDHHLYNANTTCIFFGDMQGVHFEVSELKKIVRTCRSLWLFTDEPGHYTHTGDLPKAIEAQMPIAYGISGARAFLVAVRKVRFLRKGMQIIP